MGTPILSVKNLVVSFRTSAGLVRAADGVSFDVARGETLGIVGESGCGKSVTALSIMRLLDSPGAVEGGEVFYGGGGGGAVAVNILKLPMAEMRRIRGNKIAMIFQEPMTSLNPVLTVGTQISEVLRLHEGLGKKEALDKAVEMLSKVHIPMPEKRIRAYPHQMSGGMRQRVMIAMALCCKPDVLICDEPTTALDVTIQAQILSLIEEMKRSTGAAVIMITHDLGVISEIADRVAVMYAGRVVEEGPTADVLLDPLHPYTEGLLNAVPRVDRDVEELEVIPGSVPNLASLPEGCAFRPRCRHATEACRTAPEKTLREGREDAARSVNCWKHAEKV
ncbi:MAG: ABC transporter ATP-binding protein [Synergistaceae bacterium]|jgi:peptide/nickel transport system ATP-binding protein/oligopeptide transport system ATP-binding protein|nr:ABC transporter ATP-binding protein [Synergistaceae bacterium]